MALHAVMLKIKASCLVFSIIQLMINQHQHIGNIHKKRKKRPKHYVVLASSIIYPLSTSPQIVEIFRKKSAVNVSLITFLLYLFFTFVFLSYGVSEKLKPIIVLQSLWLAMYSIVIVGIVLYS